MICNNCRTVFGEDGEEIALVGDTRVLQVPTRREQADCELCARLRAHFLRKNPPYPEDEFFSLDYSFEVVSEEAEEFCILFREDEGDREERMNTIPGAEDLRLIIVADGVSL